MAVWIMPFATKANRWTPPATPDIIYKAAGGKSLPAGRGIARAVAGYFANLDAGMRRSDSKLAELLFDPILAIMRREARVQMGEDDSLNPKDVAREMVLLAKLRALGTAASVNNTTANIITKGEADPYDASRAASIGITESNWATHATQQACLKLAGVKRWTWRAHSTACPKLCKKMEGKTVGVGEDFVLPNGERVPHPPGHVNCKCTVERFKRSKR